MSTDANTIAAYNEHAATFAKRFLSEGILEADLDAVFEAVNTARPLVLDLGCGNGKYAAPVLTRGGQYVGVDAAAELLHIGEGENPEATFVLADMVEYQHPDPVDIILSITSIVHIPREDVQILLQHIGEMLRVGGRCLLSCKEGKYGTELLEKDGVKRRFYYYTSEDITSLLPSNLSVETISVDTVGANTFLTVMLVKI